MLQIDIGCGAKKQPGFVGLDLVKSDGVDIVTDLMHDPLPFPDNSVERVFSSHFFEHVAEPQKVLHEIVRVGAPGASVEIWTPYQKSATAYLPGHVVYWSETLWSHFCLEYPDVWFQGVPGMLQLDRFHYVISKQTAQMLGQTPLQFAIRFYFDVVIELGVSFTVLKGDEYRDKAQYKKSVKPPKFTVGFSRYDVRPLDVPPNFWNLYG